MVKWIGLHINRAWIGKYLSFPNDVCGQWLRSCVVDSIGSWLLSGFNLRFANASSLLPCLRQRAAERTNLLRWITCITREWDRVDGHQSQMFLANPLLSCLLPRERNLKYILSFSCLWGNLLKLSTPTGWCQRSRRINRSPAPYSLSHAQESHNS